MKVHGLNFDNSFARLPEHFFTKISPYPVSQPEVVIINYPLAEALGLDLKRLSKKQLAQLFSGNTLPLGAEPIAQAYAGHQFGRFTYLGDGRAHLLGEHITQDGKRVDIQLKGSGKTPYSRSGDGRAALAPMLREYVISEAMHALNIASTRSLAVVTTGEIVYRETPQAGAILTRIAQSHIRVGSFEYLAAKNDTLGVEKLANYVIERHYKEVKQSHNPYLALLTAVIEKQVNLIVDWMRVGFIHGVMNTDNMALSGETIDYGPCAFMDTYHPNTVFSAIDSSGRYSYSNQPYIAQWNLARLAETLLPLLHDNQTKAIEMAEEAISGFSDLYQDKWLAMMRRKLGLFNEQSDDNALFVDLFAWMAEQEMDFTNTFYDLGQGTKPEGRTYDSATFQIWYDRWQLRLKQEAKSVQASIELMQANNPAVIPRNHKVNHCLNAASEGDMAPLNDLLKVLQEPYTDCLEIKEYQIPPTQQERVYQTFCGT